jgi:hypothetical protein
MRTGWFVLYFGRVFACSFFLRVLSFLDFESSSRTDSDTFAVSILYRSVRPKFESFASDW